MQFFFPENMLGKFLGFGRMQESKISFVINLKCFFRKCFGENRVF